MTPNLTRRLTRASIVPSVISDQHLSLAYGAAAWLRGRAQSARDRGADRVEISTAYAADLGALLERCAHAADRTRQGAA